MAKCEMCGNNTKYPIGKHKNLCADCWDQHEGPAHEKYMQNKFEREQDKKEDELIKGFNEASKV